jgi:NADPH:quinone reductase
VIAAASSEDKLKVAKEMGADFLINYSKDDLRNKVAEYTNGNLADVIYDPVGGTTFEQVCIVVLDNVVLY